MGSCLVMKFSGELELHDAIRRPDSVGYFLQFRQILPLDNASATAPAQELTGRIARRGVLRASSGRVGVDWVVSCLGWPCLLVSLPTQSHLVAPCGTCSAPIILPQANKWRTSSLANERIVSDYQELSRAHNKRSLRWYLGANSKCDRIQHSNSAVLFPIAQQDNQFRIQNRAPRS